MSEQDPVGSQSNVRTTALASVGLFSGVAAFLGASCCVLPIVLTMIGLGGSWMVVLGVLAASSWYILAVAAALVLVAWLMALRRRARRSVFVLLSLATVLLGAAALTVTHEIAINRYVIEMWSGA